MSETPKDHSVVPLEKPRSKVRPAVEWFTKKFADLSQSQWQEYTCKACGEEVKGNRLETAIQVILEMHVDRHERAGDALPT